jgi:hypothetical protein
MATFVAHRDKKDSAYAPSFSFDAAVLGNPRASYTRRSRASTGGSTRSTRSSSTSSATSPTAPFSRSAPTAASRRRCWRAHCAISGRDVPFYSIDIARDDLELARATLAERGLGGQVTLAHGSIAALLRALPTFQPRFVFVDGDHSTAGVARDLASLEPRVPAGGLLLFHDFLDPRNDEPRNRDYGVTQAVRESWVARDCEFAGAFGCTGLYSRSRGPRGAQPHSPDVLELMRLDRVTVRLLIEIARPAKRLVMRTLGRSRRARDS